MAAGLHPDQLGELQVPYLDLRDSSRDNGRNKAKDRREGDRGGRGELKEERNRRRRRERREGEKGGEGGVGEGGEISPQSRHLWRIARCCCVACLHVHLSLRVNRVLCQNDVLY